MQNIPSWWTESLLTDAEAITLLSTSKLRFPSTDTIWSVFEGEGDTCSPSTADNVAESILHSAASNDSLKASVVHSDDTEWFDDGDPYAGFVSCCEATGDALVPNERPAAMASASNESLSASMQAMMQRFVKGGRTFVDSHCHIDFLLEFSGEPDWQKLRDRYSRHCPANFGGMIQVFCHPKRFRLDDPVLMMLRDQPDVWFAFGCHPKRLTSWSHAILEALRECLTKVPNVVALGEIGLDYSGAFYKKVATQKNALRQQLDLAISLNLPIVLHCREGNEMCKMDADNDLMSILQERVPRNHPMHLHCFTRDWARAKRWLEAFPHLMIGLTPLITLESGDRVNSVVEVAKKIPLDRVLIETDAPFFIPRGIKRHELSHSFPWFAIIVAEKLAKLRKLSLDTVLTMVLSNTHTLYQLNRARLMKNRK